MRSVLSCPFGDHAAGNDDHLFDEYLYDLNLAAYILVTNFSRYLKTIIHTYFHTCNSTRKKQSLEPTLFSKTKRSRLTPWWLVVVMAFKTGYVLKTPVLIINPITTLADFFSEGTWTSLFFIWKWNACYAVRLLWCMIQDLKICRSLPYMLLCSYVTLKRIHCNMRIHKIINSDIMLSLYWSHVFIEKNI